MSELPKGWSITSLGDICDQPKQREPADEEEFIYIDIASIDRDLKVVTGSQHLLGKNAPSRARKEVETGDVIVSMTRPNLNAVALIGAQHHGCIASTGFDVLRPIEVDPRWIFAAVQSASFIESMCDKVQGALYPAIKAADIREYKIPLPPLAEQIRIAQKLDELLTQVNTLKARIGTIPARLKRLRQSILAAAVSGQLTEEWRKKISAAQPTSAETGALPSGWETDRLDNHFSAKNGKAFPSSAYQNSGVKLIRPGNLHISGKVSWSLENTVHLDQSYADSNNSFLISKGAIVMNLTAQSLKDDFLGRACIFSDNTPALLNQRQCTFKPTASNKIESNYIFIYFRSPQFREYINTLVSGSIIKHIYTKQLSEHEIPIPPSSEQKEIVRVTEHFLAFVDQLEDKLSTANNLTKKLPQNILNKALSGELTADWRTENKNLMHGENSAESLLKRIMTRRNSIKNQPKSKIIGASKMIEKAANKEITSVTDALKKSGKPLTGQQLLAAAGYPKNSSTEQLEQFFLDIREALNRQQIVRQARDNKGQDWFALTVEQ